jgi:pimeloyl-ACP methyl ester carboxylesterase
MARSIPTRLPTETQPRVRRGYFECRFGQLHVHHAMPPGGGFEEGLPLLCVHDLSGSGRMLTGLLTLVAQERSAYAPDIPGFGESDPPATRPAITDYAAALGDFLDQMRLRHVALLGVRTGALLAAELALSRPAQITRLALLSVPLLTETEWQALGASLPVPAGPDSAFRPREWQQWAFEGAAQYPLRERIGRISQRVLALRPRDDLYEATGRVRDLLAGARLSELAQPGPELLAAAPHSIAAQLREFLRP